MTLKWEHKTVELDLNEMVVKVDGWPILGVPEKKARTLCLVQCWVRDSGLGSVFKSFSGTSP